jgi:hypothetical protein
MDRQARFDKLLAALTLQFLLLKNGAEADHPEPDSYGYEPRNIFRSADGSQAGFR